MAFRFEGLEIWQRAREFTAHIHEVTMRFPQHEQYALASQMNRAADAVPLLIAEGAGLETDAQFNHRLGLSVGETFEVVSGSFLALDRKYITAGQQAQIYEQAEVLARKINAFRKTLRR
ncbi:MAG: four helix bundle protein [Chloroflexi bacterium]|nr:four helix bundle protein [Chloroflexota bacterium]